MVIQAEVHRNNLPVQYIPKVTDCNNDNELIGLWSEGKRSPHTRDAYLRDVRYFQAFVEGKPFERITLNDLQAWEKALFQQGYRPYTVRRRLSAIRSLLGWGFKIGYLPVNVGAATDLPDEEDTLSSRILSELETLKLIEATNPGRDRVLLRFIYESGCRVSEVVRLEWLHLTPRHNAVQVRFYGKGRKTRNVLLSLQLWVDLQSLRSEARYVFVSRSGKPLNRSRINVIVAQAASKAGLPQADQISPHWLRHAHATHSLERGAGIHLVAETLGHSSVAVTGRYLHARPSDSSSLYLPR